MRIAVLGLWHLGSVTAACLADAGHQVRAFDPSRETIDSLSAGRPPLSEPNLSGLVARGLQSGLLAFTTDAAEAVRDAELVWITFDTPVSEDDIADVDYVLAQVERVLPFLADGAVVVSSSQLPVGSVREIEARWRSVAAGRRASFACCPENLRLGKAIEVFTKPDRVIVGVREDWARTRIEEAFAPFGARLEWMSVESAEMTKHAVNAFLATSVSFINELAALCECVGADAREVERGLKTEARIGPQAYVAPGGAFAGGTLARDVTTLRTLGTLLNRPTALMDGVMASNAAHAQWAQRRLDSMMGPLEGSKIAIWGLTYKPGTDTLRRSSAIELAQWLVDRDARVHVHDPLATELPGELRVSRHGDPLEAVAGARALVVATTWPCYRDIDVNRLAAVAPNLIILDANRFLGRLLGGDPRFQLVTVGQPV